MNAQELISGMINRAKTAPKEEQAEILADVVTITVVAGTTPSQWVESEPALVEIHLPKTVTDLFSLVSEIIGAPIAGLESAFITECVLYGMKGQAKRASDLAKKYEKIIEQIKS